MYRCSSISLPQFRGGRDVQVTVGKVTEQQKLNPLSLKDVQMMSSKAQFDGSAAREYIGRHKEQVR